MKVLVSTAAGITTGPVAGRPGHLLAPVSNHNVRPRQPAATHTSTRPLTAEQL